MQRCFWPFRPVVVDTSNICLSNSHQGPPGKSKFDKDSLRCVIDRLLRFYLSLCFEPNILNNLPSKEFKDSAKGFMQIYPKYFQEIEDLQQLQSIIDSTEFGMSLRNGNKSIAAFKKTLGLTPLDSNTRMSRLDWTKCSEFWEIFNLPPIYALLEGREKKDIQVNKELFKELREYRFISFLILPSTGNEKSIYGDRLLADFAATMDAVVISNDKFSDLEKDPLVSELEKKAMKDDVISAVVSEGYVNLDHEDLNKKINKRPTVQARDIHKQLPNFLRPNDNEIRQGTNLLFNQAEGTWANFLPIRNPSVEKSQQTEAIQTSNESQQTEAIETSNESQQTEAIQTSNVSTANKRIFNALIVSFLQNCLLPEVYNVFR